MTTEVLDKPGNKLMYNLTQKVGRDGQINATAACVCVPTANSAYRYTANVSRYSKKHSVQILEVSATPKFVVKGVPQGIIDQYNHKLKEAEERYDEASKAISAAAKKLKELRAKYDKKTKEKKVRTLPTKNDAANSTPLPFLTSSLGVPTGADG